MNYFISKFINVILAGAIGILRPISRPLVFMILAIAASLAASGQVAERLPRISGQVVDQNGAVVVGAQISASTTLRTQVVSTLTDQDGRFTVALSPAKYSLTIVADGFETGSFTIEVTESDAEAGNIVLRVEAAAAMVTVSDDAVYVSGGLRSATKTYSLLRDVPQAITVIKQEQIRDQSMSSIADVVRYVPGVSAHQGENNRDDVIIRGNRSSADFFLDGVRDDVQYYRDLYNLESVETIKGPNAMIFGRGGGGGVINRVTKEAGFTPFTEVTVSRGSYFGRRAAVDAGQTLGKRAAIRVNGVYDGSGSFRRNVRFDRVGINPTITFNPGPKTHLTVAYEYLKDRRTADRGITSFRGRPADVSISTYYGDPENSRVSSDVNRLSGSVEQLIGTVIFRNRIHYGDYRRFYQNYVPGAVNAEKTLVSLTAYNNATNRKNFFNQTDLTYTLKTGQLRHTLVGGTEFGRQFTDNFRQTGYFNNVSASTMVPYADPITRLPITFRQSATDADNRLQLGLAAVFIQDQIEVSRYVQAIVGVRFDHFDLKYLNERTGERLGREDRLISPRLGLVIKPFTALSIYGSYSVSYLPGSGDQFSSLTVITQQVKPEKFQNYEAGLKWDIRRGLFFTAAAYRLDRTNTRATDPMDPTRIIQTGSQRTNGYEIGLTGSLSRRWTVSGGYAWQNARITSATTSAAAGKQVAQVPHNMFSLWNKYQLTRRLGAGLGLVYRSELFAAVDNTVVLPGYAKADLALYYNFSERWRLQANLENLTNVRHYVNADGNNNISPGSPRALKIGLIARF